MRKLVYYIAVSMDGFIADETGDFSAFGQDPKTLAALFQRYPETCPGHLREILGVEAPPRRFDTVLLGRRTHQPALDAGLPGGAYPHLRQVVVTHQEILGSPGVERLSGDLVATVAAMKEEPGGDIWLCGGGHLAAQLVSQVDELQLKLNPVLLGRGIPVLPHESVRSFELATTEALPGGVLLTTWRRPVLTAP